MQSVFDELYENSLAKCEFKNLISIITAEENIRLAYRNLKKNAGSRTPGTDGKTIADLAKMSEPELIGFVQQKFNWYQPRSVRRKEIPKGNGKTRPLGIPTIVDRLIQQCVLQINMWSYHILHPKHAVADRSRISIKTEKANGAFHTKPNREKNAAISHNMQNAKCEERQRQNLW